MPSFFMLVFVGVNASCEYFQVHLKLSCDMAEGHLYAEHTFMETHDYN